MKLFSLLIATVLLASSSFGQVYKVQHSGKSLWVDSVYGSDSTGLSGSVFRPYATISVAKTNASAGDVIHVLPGTYTDRDWLKAGVNYDFSAGAVVTNYYAGSGSSRGMINDYAGATTNRITGQGAFHYFAQSNGSAGLMILTNPASRIFFKASRVTCGNDDSVASEIAAFSITNCNLLVLDIDDYYDPKIDDDTVESNADCIYWNAGEMHVSIRRAKTEFGYIAWADNSANVTNNLYYNGQYAETTLGPAFYISAASRNLKTWINCLEIKADSSIAISSVNGKSGKVYVQAEKISGSPAISCNGDTEMWVTAQKLTAVDNANNSWVTVNGTSRLNLDVFQFEQVGQMSSGIVLNGGTNWIRGGYATITNLPVVKFLSGKTTIDGLTMNMVSGTTTNAPIWAFSTNAASRLTLKGVSLNAGGGTNSVYATNAQNIAAIGTVMSTNANNNVTFQGQVVTNGAFATSF